MFLKNKYYYKYIKIINIAQVDYCRKGKIAHYIIPLSCGGEMIDENLIFLTPKAKYIVTLFLFKITNDKQKHKILLDMIALSIMTDKYLKPIMPCGFFNMYRYFTHDGHFVVDRFGMIVVDWRVNSGLVRVRNLVSEDAEIRKDRSRAARNRKRTKCSYCGGMFQGQHMARYHGERCKENPASGRAKYDLYMRGMCK